MERTIERKCFLKVAPYKCINDNVFEGSIIITDFWRACISLEDHGYTHHRVYHSRNWVDTDNLASTNMIEGTWNGIKQNIKPRNQTKEINTHFIDPSGED